MAQVDSENSIRTRRSPLRDFLYEPVAIAFILVSADVAGTLIALGLAGKIARHCAVELQRALQ
jgi:hypothetical protein